MRILVNGVFGRNYRFVEVNVALFVNKTINFAFGSGEGFYLAVYRNITRPISPVISMYSYETCSEILWAILSTLSSSGFSELCFIIQSSIVSN